MAIYYVWPGAAFNGDGTSPLPAAAPGTTGAYNTWVGVTLTANNTYRQKRGTTYTGVAVRPQNQTSAAATPLTIEAYYKADGSDDPTQPLPLLVHTLNPAHGSGCIFVDTCNGVLVRNVAGTGSKGQNSSAVTIRRSQNVKVSGVEGYGNSAGVSMYQDQASGTSTCTDIEVSDCYLHDNVVGGIWFEWAAVSTAVFKRVKFLRNLIVNNGTGKYINVGGGGGSVPCGGIVSQDRYVVNGDINYRCMDFLIQNNVISNSWGYGINIQSIGSELWRSTVSKNDVSGSGLPGDIDTHSIWLGACYDCTVEKNYVHDNYGFINGTVGSGAGIILDYQTGDFIGGTGNIVQRNVVERQFRGATQVGAGASAGIYSIGNSGSIIRANVVRDCRNGISMYAGTGTPLTASVYNNTVVRAVEYGLSQSSKAAGTAVTMQNNAVVGANIGIFRPTAGAGTFSEDHNLVYNCVQFGIAEGTTASPIAATPGAGTITADPLVNTDGSPQLSTSPLYGAGTFKSYADRDSVGTQFRNPPSIGAYDTPTQRRLLNSDPAGW